MAPRYAAGMDWTCLLLSRCWKNKLVHSYVFCDFNVKLLSGLVNFFVRVKYSVTVQSCIVAEA